MSEADAELVARSRRQDADAFGVLVERHQRLVFGVALARCQDPVLAEDVAQEAFVTAWRDLDRLRDVDRVGSWVAGIARNLAASAARERARPTPVFEQAAVPTPEDEALAREDRELLQRALGEVPDAHRETLVLYYMEGQSITAIAEALGIREDLVKQRLSRGRRALRDSVTARVETVLTRARTSPTFRAGVITAIAAGGARQAKAATAGKAITMLATQKLVIAGVATLALAGGAVWLGTRARADDHKPAAAQPAVVNSATTTATKPGGAKLKVRKLAPNERTPLLDSIRQAQKRRASTNTGATSTAPSRLTPGGDGDLDKDYVRSAMQELIPLLTECYEAGLERTPKLEGTVLVEFTIEGEPGVGGLVTSSKIDDTASTLTDPGVRECIQETMYALEIDPPTSGGVVTVRYPFLFKPA